jgi:hypothetical protein
MYVIVHLQKMMNMSKCWHRMSFLVLFLEFLYILTCNIVVIRTGLCTAILSQVKNMQLRLKVFLAIEGLLSCLVRFISFQVFMMKLWWRNKFKHYLGWSRRAPFYFRFRCFEGLFLVNVVQQCKKCLLIYLIIDINLSQFSTKWLAFVQTFINVLISLVFSTRFGTICKTEISDWL